jgi:TPR repeat protein
MSRPLAFAVLVVAAAVACRTARPITTVEDYRDAQDRCRDDDQLACAYLADSLRNGGRYEQAWRLALASCDAGVGLGCANLGFFYDEGLGDVPKDARLAELWLGRGCEAGVPGACVDLGVSHLEGRVQAPDFERAAWAASRACDGGHLVGCINLGYLLEELWVGHLDAAAARRLYASSCDAGFVAGCRRTGLNLLTDSGGPADVDAGVAWLAFACDRRDARACLALGNRTNRGWGEAATRWYRRACRLDPDYGCVGLAANLRLADGGPDAWEGYDAAELACARKEKNGCAVLSDLLLRAELAPDVDRARTLGEAACEAGVGLGCVVRARVGDGGLEWLRRGVEAGWWESTADYLGRVEAAATEAARLCDAGIRPACARPDGGRW